MNIGLKRSTLIIMFFIAILLVTTFIPSNTTYADVAPYPHSHYVITNLPESHYATLFLVESPYYGEHGYLAPDIPKKGYTEDPDSENYELAVKKNLIVSKVVDRLNQESFDYYYIPYSIYGGEELTTSVDTYCSGHNSDRYIFIVYDLDNDILYCTDKTQRIVFRANYTATYPDNITSINANTYKISTGYEVVMEKRPVDAWRLNLAEDVDASAKLEDVWQTILMFVIMVIITVVVELAIALCFKFTKKSYAIIVITNVITQLIVNVIMWVSMVYGGETWGSLEGFFVAEAFVLIAEPFVYRLTCERKNGTKKLIVLYGIIANIVTIAIGLLISYIITIL
ncbi:MAG: hypothetical protein K5923_00905 [Clostridia bacterium]|nr:hypothetical protein [Clostridia bacterium]